ncbi:hypothetical protein BO71DRAFT_396839 [Aspergillus ellipticus CBS 707.79]|uniref:Uncharacterized protein n=1 Tax=Aspergillus ellipticus CBS 707.79 TaxID=1448320 RepID=A0A319DIC6_9EURO|nr:hypothetical protein BO71DRAFT_396839 [Aspergillus ellipticus CBS 707.79]
MQSYYNLILVHRPLLEFSKAREELSQARNSAQMTSTIMCAIAAANIARLVRDYREQYDIRQITSNGVHITFIAATIHLINFRLTGCDSHDQLFRGCVKALMEMTDSYPMAQKAVRILNNLVERFKPFRSPQLQSDENATRTQLDDRKSETRPDNPNDHRDSESTAQAGTKSSPYADIASQTRIQSLSSVAPETLFCITVLV